MYINYDYSGVNYNKTPNGISIVIDINKKTITNMTVTYNNIITTIDKFKLSSFNLSVNCDDPQYNKDMWYKINNFTKNNKLTKDEFIYGFSTYLSFFILMNNQDFIKLLPLTFDLPINIDDNCCDYNIMHYLTLPLNAIINIIDQDCMLYYYINSMLNFIMTWSDAFCVGPLLDYNLLTKLNYDIIKGVSKYSI